MITDPISVPPGGGRAVHWLGGRAEFLAVGGDACGAFGLFVDEPPAGGGPVPHVHTREEEFFYVLAGRFTHRTAGTSFAAEPGAFVGLPKGLGHRFHHDKDGEPGRLLAAVVPAGNERFLLDLYDPLPDPHDATDPPDAEKSRATAARYGVTLLAPADEPEAADLPLGVGRAPVRRRPGDGEAFAAGGVRYTLNAVGRRRPGRTP